MAKGSKYSPRGSQRRPLRRTKGPLIQAISAGSAISPAIERLSKEEEIALNLLLKKAGGVEEGMQLYKLGYALEDNSATWDSSLNQYKYDPNKIPLCFHENQGSYHLLSWEPPSAALDNYAGELNEDVSKGQYNCVMHFIDPETSQPIKPTMHVIELIIPVIRQFNEIAFAARRGYDATLQNLRDKRIEHWKNKERQQEKAYENHAAALLEDSKPAFEGNPTSFPKKTKSFADMKPGERQKKAEKITTANFQSLPAGFSVSTRRRK